MQSNRRSRLRGRAISGTRWCITSGVNRGRCIENDGIITQRRGKHPRVRGARERHHICVAAGGGGIDAGNVRQDAINASALATRLVVVGILERDARAHGDCRDRSLTLSEVGWSSRDRRRRGDSIGYGAAGDLSVRMLIATWTLGRCLK